MAEPQKSEVRLSVGATLPGEAMTKALIMLSVVIFMIAATVLTLGVAAWAAGLPQGASGRELDQKVRDGVRDAMAAALAAENEYLRSLLIAEEKRAALVRAIDARKVAVAEALKPHPGCVLDDAAKLRCETAPRAEDGK